MSAKTKVADEVLGVSVPVAGKRLGLGRNASYEAAARGEIPSVRVGGRIIVPIRALEAMCDSATEDWRRRRDQKREVAG
jgi:hypothetical protein